MASQFVLKIKNLFSAKNGMDEEFFDDLTDTLVEGDIGAKTAYRLTDELQKRCKALKLTEPEAVRKELRSMLEEAAKSIELTPAAKQYVADEGYDPTFGARPLKRFLQKHVETLAAKLILSSDSGLHKGAVIRMDVDEKKGGLKAEVVA